MTVQIKPLEDAQRAMQVQQQYLVALAIRHTIGEISALRWLRVQGL